MFAMSFSGQSRIDNVIDDINQSLDVILTTSKGTRIADHEFGCNVWQRLDQPITALPFLIADITNAINRYEKRITLNQVAPDINQAVNGQIHITLHYTYNNQRFEHVTRVTQ
ncbi:GPW/gp25 family protein [Pseudoalteromonas sp. Of7M-16]|uniref:GPW/gp25 family protein n=1 Tax=Pseudoalteromonas sp. Of7M-16 TaxID=2917756 RepID=UPI001EF42DB8|nr:GPW/gp25 family protein [Pseudoalteromonas sp. Of7M-16]MCG7551357.1 GPW/gp25 family protein [Pseudoalteromonas sp. Of7M-16]